MLSLCSLVSFASTPNEHSIYNDKPEEYQRVTVSILIPKDVLNDAPMSGKHRYQMAIAAQSKDHLKRAVSESLSVRSATTYSEWAPTCHHHAAISKLYQ